MKVSHLLRKMRSLADLALAGDTGELRKSWLRNTALSRLKKHGDHPFVHRDPGYPVVCHPDWHDSKHQFLYNNGDHWEMALLRRWLRPGDSVLDVGASLGLYGLGFADGVGPSGEVISVDADGFAIEKLKVAIGLTRTRQIQPLHAALTQQSGTVTFFMRKDRRETAEQSLVPSEEMKAYCEPVEVAAMTLAELCSKLQRPERLAVVKIDTEGAEVEVLKSAPKYLFQADGPLWQVEIHPSALARFGVGPQDVCRFFPALNFEVWLLAKHPLAGVPQELPVLRRLDDREAFAESLYYNLIAVPRGLKWAERSRSIAKQISR
jgi:FkbM family methyltransferase